MIPALIAIMLVAVEDAPKNDLAKLQGPWVMVSGEADGQKGLERVNAAKRLVFKDDQAIMQVGDLVQRRARIKLDPTKMPKTIDSLISEGPNEGATSRGIYEIQGDTLKTCFGRPGADRPKVFEAGAGSGQIVSTYERVKPKSSKRE